MAAVRAAGRTSTTMPLGAQQLKRQRTSTLLSLGGVTASLLVIFAQLGIERAVYESSVRLHRMVSGDLIIVPYGFKSMQLHAEVPVAVTDIIADQSRGGSSIRRSGSASCRSQHSRHADLAPASPGTSSTPEKPAVDVPGLKENLYKLRETRRILFDRDSRPYFGDLAAAGRQRPPSTRCWARPTIAACCASSSPSAPSRSARTC